MKFIVLIFLILIFNTCGHVADSIFLNQYDDTNQYDDIFTLDFRDNEKLSKEEFLEIFKYKNLRTLNISLRNKWEIDMFNENIKKLRKLNHLFIKGSFTELNSNWKSLKELSYLDLKNTNFENFPKELYELKKLGSLSITNNRVLKPSCKILNLERLHRLSINPISDSVSVKFKNYPLLKGKDFVYLVDTTDCFSDKSNLLDSLIFDIDNEVIKIWYTNYNNHILVIDDDIIIDLLEQSLIFKKKEEVLMILNEPIAEKFIIDARYKYKVQLKITYNIMSNTKKQMDIYFNPYNYIEYITIN